MASKFEFEFTSDIKEILKQSPILLASPKFCRRDIPEAVMSFPQFSYFPPEIHSLILGFCLPNDRTCLRLTCKSLYSLSPSKESVSLDNTDTGPLCGMPEGHGGWLHRTVCHKASYEARRNLNEKHGRSTPEMKCKCKTGWLSKHCECYMRHTRLHRRLKTWMPRHLNYCGECKMFTKRKKQHKGRCYHGRQKPRKYERRYWTHTSRGGSFGRMIWKKWFNNSAMNRLEARLRQGGEYFRGGSLRYCLRDLAPKAVDSQVVRDSKASTFDDYYSNLSPMGRGTMQG